MTVLGYEVTFNRRRYGRQTYCWAEVKIDGEWHDLGDPWPGVNWPRRDLEAAINYLVDLLRPANRTCLFPPAT